MDYDTEEELISELACDCCSLKILSLTKEISNLKMNLLKAETQQEMNDLDLKERDSEIKYLVLQNEEMKTLNLQMISQISEYQEILYISKKRNEIKKNKLQIKINEDLTSVNRVEFKSDVTDLLNNKIKDMQSEIENLNKKEMNLKQEIISIKDEARNALDEFMVLKRNYDELKKRYEGTESTCNQLRDLKNQQELRISSVESELIDLRGKDLIWKSKASQNSIDKVKLTNELFLCQFDLNEKKRILEIQNNSFKKSTDHIIELHDAISKLKQQLLAKDNDKPYLKPLISTEKSCTLSVITEDKFKDLEENNKRKIECLKRQVKDLENERNILKRKYEDLQENYIEVKKQNEDKNYEISTIKNEMSTVKAQYINLKEDNKDVSLGFNEQKSDLKTKNEKINELTISLLSLEAKIENEVLNNDNKNQIIRNKDKKILELKTQLDAEKKENKKFQKSINEEKLESKHILVRIPQRRVRFINSYKCPTHNIADEHQYHSKYSEIMEELRKKDCSESKRDFQ